MKNRVVTLILALFGSSSFLRAQSQYVEGGQTPSPFALPTLALAAPSKEFVLKAIPLSGKSMPHIFSNFQIAEETDSQTQNGPIVDYEKLDKRADSFTTDYKASRSVPIDDPWIYPAFDRLAARGYLPTSTAILRPWTRLECARLLAEAHVRIDNPDDMTASLLAALDTEFRYETDVIDGGRNASAKADEVYTRVTGVTGTPLRDGFHFASTIVNDFGRPFGQGINTYDGLSAHAQFGPLVVYGRAEYQYASAMPAYSAATQQFLNSYAFPPYAPAGWNLRFGTTSRLRPVETYVALNLARWQFSFGQQSLWWGPDRSTSLILSNNAEALPMFRIARAKPMILPGFLSKVGSIHLDMFLARQGGIHYVTLGNTFTPYGSASKSLTPPPYLWGFAFTIKPSEYLELGFAHTVIFAGYGRPLNLKTFFHTFSVDGNGQEIDPGKRVTAFNFAYHPPFLRKSLVLYTEAMAWDNPIQGKFVGRYAFSPGIYIPQIPKLPRLDLRLEGVYTDLPKLPAQGYFYNNSRYVQGYTNYGQILGSWVGPEGIGGEGSTTYWFSARTKASVNYRKMVTDQGYFEGGHRSDVFAKFAWLPSTSVEVSGTIQYGRWNFIAIAPETKSDFTTTLQVRFFPKTPSRH
jgi:hypothetical protein